MILGIELIYILLIIARMSGFVFFSSVFGRPNISAIFKVSFTLILSMIVYSLLPEKSIVVGSYIELAILIIKELFIGFVVSYITNVFFGIFVISGEVIGMQIGLGMTRLYDPQTNISTGIVGSFFTVFVMMIFFLGNGHLTLINIMITSCKVIEIGDFTIPTGLYLNLVEMFSQMLVLALKISMPIIVIQTVVESGVGVLMKVVPQVKVFAVNIQLKLLVGMILLVFLTPVISSFIEQTLTIMFDQLQRNLSALI